MGHNHSWKDGRTEEQDCWIRVFLYMGTIFAFSEDMSVLGVFAVCARFFCYRSRVLQEKKPV